MLNQLTGSEIMDHTPATADAVVWVDEQCEGCPLAGICDGIDREVCGGALMIDSVSEYREKELV